MAMAADSSVNNHSQPVTTSSSSDGSGGGGGGGVNSPQPRRQSLPSPWAQVVRGGEVSSAVSTASAPRSPSSSPPVAVVGPEQTPLSDCSGKKPSPESSGCETQPESSDGSNGNVARSKKPAWNKPLNGVVEASSVMGGSVSWPALSESTQSSTKSSSSDSPKPLSDGSTSSSQGPIISQPPQKQANTNANTNAVANHGMTRQKSMKHRGGGSAQGGFRPPPPPPPMPPPFPTMIEIPPYGNYGNFVPPALDSSVRGARPVSGVGPQSGNDHSPHSQRNSSRRNNFGGRPRGDGQYHSNHGGRRDHDRRDVHIPHQFVPPPGGCMPLPPPPPPGSASFMGPPPMRPFVGPMGFDMASPYMYVPALPAESFRGMPFIPPAPPAPPAPMFFPVMDPLPALIIKQIDYYFSDANLVKDDYLRSNMDDEGWVSINLIASFPRVQQLTTDVTLILDSLRASVVVEIKEQGDKVRRRNEWKKWTQSGSRISPDSGSKTPGTSPDDNLTASVEKMALNEASSSKRGGSNLIDSEIEMAPDLPDESTGSSKMANGEVAAEGV